MLGAFSDFPRGGDGGFDEQGGATSLLVPKILFVLTGSVIGAVTFAGLFTGGAQMVQHPISFVGMLVGVRGLFARVGSRTGSLVVLHAQIVILVELDRDPVDMTSGFRRARRGAVGPAIAITELGVPAAVHGGDKLLEPGFSQKQLDPGPIGPLKVLVLKTFKKSTVHSQNTRKIESVVHGSEFLEVGQLVCYLNVKIAGWRLSEDLANEAID